jgi:hypothetical protein
MPGPKKIDLTGSRFGRWQVLAHRGGTRWLCRCDCGIEKPVTSDSLKAGKTNSCGCLHREMSTKHGMEGTPTHRTWAHMLYRCRTPTHRSFHNYGGRGITVCDRWLTFKNFLSDMGVQPNGLTLDRIDNDGPYSPENCRWATRSQQNRNRRASPRIEWNGELRSLADAAEERGLEWRLVYRRVRAGWSVKDALATRPIRKNDAVAIREC